VFGDVAVGSTNTSMNLDLAKSSIDSLAVGREAATRDTKITSDFQCQFVENPKTFFHYFTCQLLGVRADKVFFFLEFHLSRDFNFIYFLGLLTKKSENVSKFVCFLFSVFSRLGRAASSTRRKVIMKIDKRLVNLSVKINGR
jgi:hypothetical protein